MKKLTLALLITALYGCASPSQQPLAITKTTDKYTGITTSSLDSIELSLSRSIKLTKVADPRTKGLSAVLLIYIKNGAYDSEYSKKWQYLTDKRGYLMLDGKPVSLGEGEHFGDTRISGAGGVYLIESVSFILKPEMIGGLVSVHTISGRVGSSEFTLTPKQVESVNDFILKAMSST